MYLDSRDLDQPPSHPVHVYPPPENGNAGITTLPAPVGGPSVFQPIQPIRGWSNIIEYRNNNAQFTFDGD